MGTTIALGNQGEELACRYLRRRGYRVIRRNWRCATGEIDVIACHGDRTVVIEVKTRSGLGYGHPFESITPSKVARLRRLALEWANANGVSASSLRIDAIAVTLVPEQPAIYEHLEGIA